MFLDGLYLGIYGILMTILLENLWLWRWREKFVYPWERGQAGRETEKLKPHGGMGPKSPWGEGPIPWWRDWRTGKEQRCLCASEITRVLQRKPLPSLLSPSNLQKILYIFIHLWEQSFLWNSARGMFCIRVNTGRSLEVEMTLRMKSIPCPLSLCTCGKLEEGSVLSPTEVKSVSPRPLIFKERIFG